MHMHTYTHKEDAIVPPENSRALHYRISPRYHGIFWNSQEGDIHHVRTPTQPTSNQHVIPSREPEKYKHESKHNHQSDHQVRPYTETKAEKAQQAVYWQTTMLHLTTQGRPSSYGTYRQPNFCEPPRRGASPVTTQFTSATQRARKRQQSDVSTTPVTWTLHSKQTYISTMSFASSLEQALTRHKHTHTNTTVLAKD